MLLGIDIGGTKIAGVALRGGQRVAALWSNHSARGIDDVSRLIAKMAHDLLAGQGRLERVDAVLGVSVAGLVARDGRVTRNGVLFLNADDVAEAVRQACGLQARVVNDAEATLRAAIDADPERANVHDAVLLALGTGVGGAVMWHDRILHGHRGFAGELGHLPVLEPLGYPCVCGGFGCLEQFASGRGLAERASAAAAAGDAEDLMQHAGVTANQLTAVHVLEGAAADVRSAVALVDDAALALAQAIVAISAVSEPARVYLGGSLGHAAARQLLPRITQELVRRWPFGDSWPPPDVTLDRVGGHAAAVGAALIAMDGASYTPCH